jgi:hypothetical protein
MAAIALAREEQSMSTAPIGPEPAADPAVSSEIELDDSQPALHLVPLHEHEWSLRDIEYDDRGQVRRFECDVCGDVTFG